MKKKCIALLVTLCMLCVLSTTAFASDTPVYGNESADTTLTYHIDSQYMVYIPQMLDLTYMDASNPYTFTAGMMELQDNEIVRVRPTTDTITLSNSNGATISGNFDYTGTRNNQAGNTVAEFSNGQLTSNFGIFFILNGDSGFHAGDFTGTVTFTVSLETV